MKRFKLGFLAVVALVAMSFTLINNTEANKTKKTTTCQAGYLTGIDVFRFDNLGQPSCTTQDDPISCGTTDVNKLVKNSTTITGGNEFECSSGNVFCCATFTTQNCDLVSYKKIVTIICGTPEL